jgi:hypothetical protein
MVARATIPKRGTIGEKNPVFVSPKAKNPG